MPNDNIYRTINKEIILEVQKLRSKVKEKEDMVASLENELYREKQENCKLKTFISKTFTSYYSFNTDFVGNYEHLVRSGITGIEMAASATENHPSSVRSSRHSGNSERSSHLRRRNSYSPGNSINVCYPSGFVRSPRALATVSAGETISENEENEHPESDRYRNNSEVEETRSIAGPSSQQIDTAPQENLGLSIINETQSENDRNSTIREDQTMEEAENNEVEDVIETLFEASNVMESSEMEIDTSRVALANLSLTNITNAEESFQLNNSILNKVASTPYVPKRLSTEASRELTVVVKKLRLSQDEIERYSTQYNGYSANWTSYAGTSDVSESTLTAHPKKKKVTKKVRTTERKSSGRPKRTAKPKAGTLVERPVNSKLRRSK